MKLLLGFVLAAVVQAATTNVCLRSWQRRRMSAEEQVDRLCFVCDLKQFDTEWRSSARSRSFEWWTDGCTASPDRPIGLDYRESCRRHDFCYHTLHKQGRFYPAVKKEVDRVFYRDLNKLCVGKYSAWKLPQWLRRLGNRFLGHRFSSFNPCEFWARLYHTGVDWFGHLETRTDSPPGNKRYGVVNGRVRPLS